MRRITGPDDVIVGLGMGWSCEIPYYSGRRGVMVPNAGPETFQHLLDYLPRLRGYRVTALVVYKPGLPGADEEVVRRRMGEAGFGARRTYSGPRHEVYALEAPDGW